MKKDSGGAFGFWLPRFLFHTGPERHISVGPGVDQAQGPILLMWQAGSVIVGLFPQGTEVTWTSEEKQE